MVQWIIDQAVEAIEAKMKGLIVMWHGKFVDIPEGWALCDGENGTPDLNDYFICSTIIQANINKTGGAAEHFHRFSADAHRHVLADGDDIAEGDDYSDETDQVLVTGETDIEGTIPPYYTLAFIMKL